MWRFVVLFCVMLAGVKGQETTDVSRCTSNPGELPINTYVEGCTTPPCLLPQLQDVVLNVVFRAPRMMPSMSTVVTAYLGLIPIPYDLNENSVTCNFLTNTYCPVLKDEVVQYTLKMYIEPFFPVGTQVTLEFRVIDHDRSPVICIRVPIRIVAAVPSSKLGAANATLALGDQ